MLLKTGSINYNYIYDTVNEYIRPLILEKFVNNCLENSRKKKKQHYDTN